MKVRGHLHSFPIPIGKTGILETAAQYHAVPRAAPKTEGGSTMKHTKGPWRKGDGLGEIEGQFEGEWIHLANVGGVRWRGQDNKNTRYQAEMKANRQLMLVAPALLEALEALAYNAIQTDDLADSAPLYIPCTAGELRSARIAIAKVKGQEK